MVVMFGSPTPPKGQKKGVRNSKTAAKDPRRFDKGIKQLVDEMEERHARETAALRWESTAPTLSTADAEHDACMARILSAPEEVFNSCEADMEATRLASLMRTCFSKPSVVDTFKPSGPTTPGPRSASRPRTAGSRGKTPASRTPDTLRSRTPVIAQGAGPARQYRESPHCEMMTLD